MNARVLNVAALAGGGVRVRPGARVAAPATDGPGAMSHFALARKDCVGTAHNDRSKVWFTVADGVLSDVYYPTNDNTNNETLQYVVTDGSTFTDLQTRDMTYTVQALDKRALTCRVVGQGQERQVPHHHRLPDRPGPPDGHPAQPLRGAQGRTQRLQASTSASTRTSTATAAAAPGNGGADTGAVAPATCSSARTP